MNNLRRGDSGAPGGGAGQEALVIAGPDGDAHVPVALHAPHPGEGLVDRQTGAQAAGQHHQQAAALHCSDEVE